jgi:hypothetical protein
MQWNMHHLFDLLHLLIPNSEIIFLSKIWWEEKEDLQQWIIWWCSKVWSYHHLNMRRKIVREYVRTSWIWACLQLGLLVSSLRGFQLTGLATSSRTRDCFLISLRREKTGVFRFSLLKTGNCGDCLFLLHVFPILAMQILTVYCQAGKFCGGWRLETALQIWRRKAQVCSDEC